MDKRVTKTRKAILNAVLDITADTELSKLKVTQICKAAGINKSTFYLHYNSVNDCVTKCVGYMVESLGDIIKDMTYERIVGDSRIIVERILIYAERNKSILERYQKSKMFSVTIGAVAKTIVATICRNSDIEQGSRRFLAVNFLVNGTIACVYNSLPDYNREDLGTVLLEQLNN